MGAQDPVERSWWKQVTDTSADEIANWNKQGGILHANDAINKISGFPEMAARMFNGGETIKDAWQNTFTDIVENEFVDKAGNKVAAGTDGARALRKTRWGKLAGSVWAAGTALSAVGGAARGALTDKNGNFDIPGIPLI